MRLKKILICSNVYPPNFIGGAELIAHFQGKLLQERGHEVIAFTGDNVRNDKRYALAEDMYEGLTVFRVCLHPQDYQWDLINFSHPAVDAHFTRLIDEFSPDVVHMHNIIGLSTGIIHIAKNRGAKTVLTLHDHWGFCYKNTLLKRGSEICRDYSRCAECMPFVRDETGRNIPIRMRQDFLNLQLQEVDAFISPSLYLAQAYISAGIPIGKMNVIWNGVDVARFTRVVKKPREGKVRFTFIGYFGFHKGINVFLDALSLIRTPDRVSVNLVGAGEQTDSLRDKIATLGLSRVVRFWGKVDNSRIEEVFAETDVQVLPSLWPENQPVSITEAMATRTAVIASAIGGIPELVMDGYSGYLFTPGNAAQLAEKMVEFISHPERIELFGQRGFERIADKSFGEQLERVCELYEGIGAGTCNCLCRRGDIAGV